jgi:2-polyprenyl-3-methyl-5-hydroxy-6-metoxy-1,4-benzoquinol methylase
MAKFSNKKKRFSRKQKYSKKNKSRKNKKIVGGGPYEDDVKRQFDKAGRRFNDQRVLDIGTRDGLNCITLVELGASEVIGIDINDSRFHEMPPNPKVKLIKQDLLDFSDDVKFDAITCFLWNMPIPQYDGIMNKIKSLLKPNGFVFIGVHDQEYKTGIGSVPELLKRYFKSSWILDKSSPYQWIIVGTDF